VLVHKSERNNDDNYIIALVFVKYNVTSSLTCIVTVKNLYSYGKHSTELKTNAVKTNSRIIVSLLSVVTFKYILTFLKLYLSFAILKEIDYVTVIFKLLFLMDGLPKRKFII